MQGHARRLPACFLVLATTMLIMACGGGSSGGGGDDGATGNAGGDDSDSGVVAFGGKVIDGYISGATIFLDLNFNGSLDAGEPSATSTDAGDYTLELGEELHACAAYVPLVVNVPVGAIDEDEGEVTEAYQMAFPPSFDALEGQTDVNVSPLTTVVWSAISAELAENLAGLSCDTLLVDDEQREVLRDTLSTAIDDMVEHYNISEKQLFADFIANADSEAKEKAVSIVKGLKKSFEETLKAREQYPDALYVKVDYHQFDRRDAGELYPDAWYRDMYVYFGDSSISRLDKVSDDLSGVVRTIIHGERRTAEAGDLSFYESSEFESRDGDDSPYSCDSKEGISTSSTNKQYELTNLISKSATAFADCTNVSFSADAYMRYAFVEYSEGEVHYGAQFFFERTVNGFPQLNDWIDLEVKLDSLSSSSLVAAFESLPYRYEETGMGGADRWVKTRNYPDGENQVHELKFSDGSFQRRTTYPDGTWLEECSADGVSWAACD